MCQNNGDFFNIFISMVRVWSSFPIWYQREKRPRIKKKCYVNLSSKCIEISLRVQLATLHRSGRALERQFSQAKILAKSPWNTQQKHARNCKFVKNVLRKSVALFK